MKENKTPKRVTISQKINGQIALEMRKKSPRASLEIDRKKQENKYRTRTSYQYERDDR